MSESYKHMINESSTLDEQIQMTDGSIRHYNQLTSQDEQIQDQNESISLHNQNSVQDGSVLLANEQLEYIDEFIFNLNDSSLQSEQNQVREDSMFLPNESTLVHEQSQVNGGPPILHLRGYTFLHEKIQVTDESIVHLSGSTSLDKQILDLIFELKPTGNYSDVIYGVEHFVPNNRVENVLLLGLLKRSVILFGTRETPLFKSRYTDADELFTLSNEFVLSLVKFNQYELLLNLLETIVISSNYDSNVLLQYALLLDKMGHHKLALEYFILIAEASKAYYLNFIIIHTYYVHLNDFDSGIKWCYKLLKLKNVSANVGLKSKCFLYLGIGYYWKQLEMRDSHCRKTDGIFINKHSTLQNINEDYEMLRLHRECPDKHYHIQPHDISLSTPMIGVQCAENKSSIPEYSFRNDFTQPLLEQSLSHLVKAAQCDSQNHLVYYYLSLVSAQGSNMTQAMAYIKLSLKLNSEFLPSLHLLVLLESTHNIFSAESLLQSVIHEYPDSVQLYLTHAYISMSQENYTKALCHLRGALILWEKLYGDKDVDVDYQCCECDSGQYSVDYFSKIDFFNLPGSTSDRMSLPDSNKDAENNSGQSDQLRTTTKRVTFQVKVPSEDKLPSSKSSEELAVIFPDPGDKEDDLVENLYNHVRKTLYSATICHDELPSKQCLLIDIWGMLARIYLALNSEEDFVQCLCELLNICEITSSYVGSIGQSTLGLVFSKHCAEILLHLGIYFEKQGDLKRAKVCLSNVLNLSHNHVEALYHQCCIEKQLGLLDRALLSIHHSLQCNDVGVFRGKLYFLMGEVYDELGDPDNASVAYEVAFKFNDATPVCSFDILPFVWQ